MFIHFLNYFIINVITPAIYLIMISGTCVYFLFMGYVFTFCLFIIFPTNDSNFGPIRLGCARSLNIQHNLWSTFDKKCGRSGRVMHQQESCQGILFGLIHRSFRSSTNHAQSSAYYSGYMHRR